MIVANMKAGVPSRAQFSGLLTSVPGLIRADEVLVQVISFENILDLICIMKTLR